MEYYFNWEMDDNTGRLQSDQVRNIKKSHCLKASQQFSKQGCRKQQKKPDLLEIETSYEKE
jgi:hypothetical protein